MHEVKSFTHMPAGKGVNDVNLSQHELWVEISPAGVSALPRIYIMTQMRVVFSMALSLHQ